MATFHTFEQIEAWQLARELTREIYAISGRGPLARDFSLKDQVRRSAVSAMSNIAEGFERDGRKEFLQFLAMGKGSLGEVRSQLVVALDARLIDSEDFERLNALAKRTSSTIAGLMRHLRISTIAGPKYRNSSN